MTTAVEASPYIRAFIRQWEEYVVSQPILKGAVQRVKLEAQIELSGPLIEAVTRTTPRIKPPLIWDETADLEIALPEGLTVEGLVAFVREKVAALGGDPDTIWLTRVGDAKIPFTVGTAVVVTHTICHKAPNKIERFVQQWEKYVISRPFPKGVRSLVKLMSPYGTFELIEIPEESTMDAIVALIRKKITGLGGDPDTMVLMRTGEICIPLAENFLTTATHTVQYQRQPD